MFLLLGLGAGAVYAALALGLVLTFRASGVVNFAHGAMAMYATYVFVELRESGDLVLPVVGLPARFHLGDRPPVAVAMGVALACAALLGLAVYGLVFRPLRRAPVLARVVASVGVMVALQAVVVLRFGTGNRSVAAVLPARPVTLGHLVVPGDRLALAGLAVLAAVVLWAVYRFTLFGMASRAAVQDERGLSLLGWSPDALAGANWVVASVLAGLAGILVGPITALNPVTYTLLVVPALAAALVGGLDSFGVATAAGLALGMAQSELVRLQARFSALPRLGLREGLPLLVIVAAIALRGGRRGAGHGVSGRLAAAEGTDRAGATPPRLPRAGLPRRPLRSAAACATVAGASLFWLAGAYRLGLITSMIGALICLSLVVLTGYAGQISLAQMAFAGVAGFALSRLGSGLGVPFPLAPALAAGLAALGGLLVGFPARRGRGTSLAVVTLAAGVAVEELVFANASISGGLAGTRVGPPRLGGMDLGIGGGGPGGYPRPAFGLLVLAVLVACSLGVAGLRRGGVGRRLLAVRANERAAAAAGVDVARAKLAAFTLSAFIAGLAGSLLGYEQGRLSVESFGVFVSLGYLAVAYLGGIARISGAMVGGCLVGGGIVFTVLDQVAGLGRYQVLASGVGLVMVAVLSPEGLAGAGRHLGRRGSAARPAGGRTGGSG